MMLEAVGKFDFVAGEGEGEGDEGDNTPTPITTATTEHHTLRGALPNLCMYFVGGEMLSRDLALSFFRSSSPSARLFNMYGSTETTADATYLECVREGEGGEWGWMDGECRSVPVGRPAPNTVGLVKLIREEGEQEGKRVGELYMAGLSGSFFFFFFFFFFFSFFFSLSPSV